MPRGEPDPVSSNEQVPVPRGGPDPAWAAGRAGPGHGAVDAPTPPASPAAAPPDGATALPRRTHRWGIGAYVVVEAVFVGVSLLIGFAFLGKPVSVTALTVALAVPTVLAAGVAMLITRLRGNGPRTDLGLDLVVARRAGRHRRTGSAGS